MICLKVPCSLDYRDLTVRLVAAACKLVQRKGRELCLAVDAVVAMLTRDERAIRQDCLGYLMRPVTQPLQ